MDKKFSKTEEDVSSEVVKETTAMIAKQLNESAIERLGILVEYLGPQVALEIMQDTLKIEEEGGMLIQNGTRRRTPGGIFFYLVKQGVDKKDRRKLFPYTPSRQSQFWPKKRKTATASSNHHSIWQKRRTMQAEYQPAMKELLKSREFGMADSMSVKLIGRPGKVVEQDSFVMTMMQLSQQLPSVSKDLPTMPTTKLRLLVYMTKKQWNEVFPSLQQPENSLNISGILTYDEILRRMVLFSRAVTVKIGQPTVRTSPDTGNEAEESTTNEANNRPEPSDVQDAALALLKMEVNDKQDERSEANNEQDGLSDEQSLEEEFEEDKQDGLSHKLSLGDEFEEDKLDEQALNREQLFADEFEEDQFDLERG